MKEAATSNPSVVQVALRLVRRRRAVLLLSLASAVTASMFWTFLATPVYRAEATLQLEREGADVLTFQGLNRPEASWVAYANYFQTQYELMRSEAVARLAAEEVDLLSRPGYRSEDDEGPGLVSRLLASIPGRRPTRALAPEEVAASIVLGGLDVAPVTNSELVRLSWTSPDPELAADVANAVAGAYIRYNLLWRNDTGEEAERLLQEQIATLKAEISDAEDKLQTYGERTNIVSADGATNITLQGLKDLAAERTEAQSRLAAARARRAAIDGSPDEALAEVRSSPIIQELRSRASQIDAGLTDLTGVFKDDWPEVRKQRSRLEQVHRQLADETAEIARRVRLAAENDYLRAREEVAQIERLLAEHQRAAQRMKRDAVEYNNLLADVAKKRETLDNLIERSSQVVVSARLGAKQTAGSNVRVVAPAKVPTAPIRPRPILNLLLGVILGLGFGVLGALVLEQIDNTMSTPHDVESVSGLPTLAVIPSHAAADRNPGVGPKDGAPDWRTIVAHDTHSPAAEAFRDLRTALLLSGAGRPPRTIMITSPLPSEGKSTTSINLATALAQRGDRVLLIDGDLRRPTLHRAFGMDNDHGLSTVLSGIESDEDPPIVNAAAVDGLDLLPSGPVPPNPTELLDSNRLGAWLGRLSAKYDQIIVDSPPTLPVADPVILSAHVDAFVLVVRAESTSRPALAQAVEKYRLAGRAPVGVVLNDAPVGPGSYGAERYRYRSETGRPPSRSARRSRSA